MVGLDKWGCVSGSPVCSLPASYPYLCSVKAMLVRVGVRFKVVAKCYARLLFINTFTCHHHVNCCIYIEDATIFHECVASWHSHTLFQYTLLHPDINLYI